MTKISIRFYNDREVRAIWDEEKSKWWFSAVDIVAAITDSPNPRKYWSVMKTRMKKAENELTTKCSQLKLTAADGKKYATDCFIQDDITELVKAIPSKRSTDFLDWFTYSDNTIDGQSRKKVYSLFESGMLNSLVNVCNRYTPTCLAACMNLQGRFAQRISVRVDLHLPMRCTSQPSCQQLRVCQRLPSMRLPTSMLK